MNRQRVTDIVRAIRAAEDLYPMTASLNDIVGLSDIGDKAYWAAQWNITEREAQDVMMLTDYDDTPDISDFTPEQCVEFCAEIAEGLHSSLDGWDYDDQTVIELFITDITRNITVRRQ